MQAVRDARELPELEQELGWLEPVECDVGYRKVDELLQVLVFISYLHPQLFDMPIELILLVN